MSSRTRLYREIVEKRCVVCGSGDELEIDHILPRSLGGKDEFDNLQILCRKCNQQKSSHLVFPKPESPQLALRAQGRALNRARRVVVAMRFTADEYDRLSQIAERFGIPVANLARAIVLGTITPDGQIADRKPQVRAMQP